MNHSKARGAKVTTWLDEIDNHSSDEDFSPGQLIIDTVDPEDRSSDRKRKAETPSTPSPSRSCVSSGHRSQQPIVVQSAEKLKESDFKGLTFVGRMEVKSPDDPPDNLCLYSYHWGNTHLDIITRNQSDTLIPMKNVYQRVVLGLTRNAVSNRVPKIGAKTIALPDSYIGILKKLQLPITARSHYLLVVDFIEVCRYYGHNPPPNLRNFASINSRNDPAEVLKSFNSQNPVLTAPMLAPRHSPPDDLGVLSPGRLNASLASSGGMSNSGHLPSASPGPWEVNERGKSPRRHEEAATEASRVEVHTLHFPNGQQMALLMRDSTPYFLNSELSIVLPAANQSNISSVRHNLGIPLENASRLEMNALKSASMVGMKAGRVVIYKVADVVKMFGYWMRCVPQFIHDICNGRIPVGVVDTTPIPSFPGTPPSPGKKAKLDSATPPLSGKQLVPPLKIKLESGVVNGSGQSRERKSSHSGQMPLLDQELDYSYLPWGESKTITLLCSPPGEPHVAIAELVDKIFDQRSQISLQRRTKLGISTVPATSLQIHALRARGSIDPSSGYSKLVPLSGVVRLANEAGIHVPQGVLDECQKHISGTVDELLTKPSPGTPHVSPSSVKKTFKKDSGMKLSHLMGPVVQLRRDIINHPDVILLDKEFQSSDGALFQVLWGKAKITLFTSARRITYVGLFQVFDTLFKSFTTRMNFKMRMRKLSVKSIRAPSSIRVSLIKLNSLPPSSPVCGLIRISEMERLAKSYEITPPKVFYDLFLNKVRLQEEQRSVDEEAASQVEAGHFMTHPQSCHYGSPHSGSTLIVSIPKDSISLSPCSEPKSSLVQAGSHSVYNPRSYPGFGHFTYHNKPSVLQNLAKKISQKNHRLASAASVSSSISGGTKVCTSCGRSNPILKKRCQHCEVFLIGRSCRRCQTVNHNRSAYCIRCGSRMQPEKGQEDHFQPNSQVVNGSPEKQSNHGVVPRLKRARSNSSSSDSQQSSFQGPLFNPPPIRTAVLKKMFPEEGGPSAASGVGPSEEEGSLVTKTMYTGSLASSRKCLDCATLNSRMAKKCVNCKAPLQGRSCPRCSRPNHNHSSECYKCGGPLPPTATKWIIGNKIFKSSQDSATVTPLKKAAAVRAPIICIRCRRIREKNKLKCGRCGDLYNVSPVFNLSGGVASKRQDPLHPPSQDDGVLLSFAHNLVTAGVGAELAPTLAEVEKESKEKLGPVEDEFEKIDEEYQTVLYQKTDKESLLSVLEVELSRLLIEVEGLNSRLQTLLATEEDARDTLESDPKEISLLENRLTAIDSLLSQS